MSVKSISCGWCGRVVPISEIEPVMDAVFIRRVDAETKFKEWNKTLKANGYKKHTGYLHQHCVEPSAPARKAANEL